MPPGPRDPARITAIAERLRIDALTVEVVGAFRSRGLFPILIKGPSIARWLYADDLESRQYTDVDLVVSPADTAQARASLEEMGYEPLPHPPLDDHALHARPYRRRRDGANVDLHRSLHGLYAVAPELVWKAVSTATDEICVGGVSIDIPSVPVRTLLLVLHLGPTDDARTHAWCDLHRALAALDDRDWAAAVSISRDLGVEHELAVRLRRLPEGRDLADRLGVADQGSAQYRMLGAVGRGQAPTSVLSIFGFSQLRDWDARIAYIRGKLSPDDETLRGQSSLARHGHLRLARVLRPLVVVARLPGAIEAWLRYYRA